MLSVPALARNFKKSIEAGIKAKGPKVEKLYHFALENAIAYNREYWNKGGWQKIPSGLSMDSKAFEGADFHPDEVYGINSGDSKTSVLTFNDSAFELVASNDLIIQGHGVIMTKVVVKAHETSGISNALIFQMTSVRK